MHITSKGLQVPINSLDSISQNVAKGTNDITNSFTDLIVAKESFRANLATVRTQDQTLGAIIDLKV